MNNMKMDSTKNMNHNMKGMKMNDTKDTKMNNMGMDMNSNNSDIALNYVMLRPP